MEYRRSGARIPAGSIQRLRLPLRRAVDNRVGIGPSGVGTFRQGASVSAFPPETGLNRPKLAFETLPTSLGADLRWEVPPNDSNTHGRSLHKNSGGWRTELDE